MNLSEAINVLTDAKNRHGDKPVTMGQMKSDSGQLAVLIIIPPGPDDPNAQGPPL